MISVVVPLYNQEKYIEKCVKTILQQTYSNIEVVIVDDGSADASYHICKKLQKEDSRIRLFHQENKGSVAARKLGVEKSRGEMVMFVDGDDYVDEHIVETLVNFMDVDTDLVASGMKSSSHNLLSFMGNTLEAGTYRGKDLENIFDKLIFNSQYHKAGVFQSACAKLYRKELLWKCIKDEDDRITLGDDAAVVFLYVLNSHKIVLSDDAMYYYRINSESMTHNLGVSVFEEISVFFEYMKRKVGGYPVEWGLQKQLKQYIIHFLQMAVKSIYDIDFVSQYYIQRRFCDGERVLLYGAGKVGISLYNHFMEQGINVVSWVDCSKAGEICYGRTIQNIQSIKTVEFDYLVVALFCQETAEEVKEYLIEMGVESRKIYWEMPKVNNWTRVIGL